MVYTSGTLGQPKGVRITFGSLDFQCRTIGGLFGLEAGHVGLCAVPLYHLFGLVAGLLVPLSTGGLVCFVGSLYPEDVLAAMRARRVQRAAVVPIFLRLLARDVERRVARGGRVRRAAFAAALAVAAYLPLGVRRWLFGSTVHAHFGGALRLYISGAAAVDLRVARLLDRLGMPVYEGYGLTEAGPVVAVNAPGAARLGSVGRPLPGVEVRIRAIEGDAVGGEGATRAGDVEGLAELHSSGDAGEGEIVVRGPNVMDGYEGDSEATREALDAEGWLHTGDIGRLDRDGFLYVTGRLKSLIVLGSGKKVNPEEVEAALLRSPLIKEAAVVAGLASENILQGTEQVWALVVPGESLEQGGGSPSGRTGAGAATAGNVGATRSVGSTETAGGASPASERAEAGTVVRGGADLQMRLEAEVVRMVRDLAPHKRPQRVIVAWGGLPRTSTGKVRRAALGAWLSGHLGAGSVRQE